VPALQPVQSLRREEDGLQSVQPVCGEDEGLQPLQSLRREENGRLQSL